MAYDAARQRVLLTGGSTPVDGGKDFRFFDDLWAFDGSRWTQLASSSEPMSGSRLAFDTRRRRMLSFGGFNGSPLADLRALEADRWRTIGRLAEMPAAEPGVVYDSRRDRLVAFGGAAGQGPPHGDTWEYDGTAWAKLSARGPSPRQALAMVYDDRRGRTIVFGGMGAGPAGQRPPVLGDTWEFDGTAWTEQTVPGPSARHSAGVAYDSRRGLVILFGGLDSTGFRGDTWSWDGRAWRKLSDTGPAPRGMGYLAYDRRRDRVVLFGGRKGYPNGDLNDTWEWNGKAWRRIGD